MSTADATPAADRATPPRRVLLAAGGLVLLGGCAASGPARPPAATATRRTSPPATPPTTSPTPAVPPDQSGSAEVHPSPVTAPASQPAPVPAGRPIDYVTDGSMAIALTIDDGPSPVYTPLILRLLDRYQVTATFCMVGLNVAAYPDLVRAVADAGHEIVNHTWTHANLTHLPVPGVYDQISRATDAIYQATGSFPRLFRAPYGAWSPTVLRQCAQAGLTPLGWSVDPRDWSRPGVPAIVANIMRHTRTGSIILEHDGGGNRAQTVAALRIVLPRLLAAGFRFGQP